VFDNWLTDDAGPEFHQPETAFAACKARAQKNAARSPADRIGFLLPYALTPARELAQPLPGAPEEMV